MALITSIQRSRRIIRCHKRTVMEVNFDERLFSIWTAAAGAECGSSLSAANIQLCLLYTSDAADDLTRVDLGGRRIIKKIFSSRRRHTRCSGVSWARRCV